MRRIVGITGGIGSGKSVVSRILRLKGYEVYDCDSQAKSMMDSSERILSGIRSFSIPTVLYAGRICPPGCLPTVRSFLFLIHSSTWRCWKISGPARRGREEYCLWSRPSCVLPDLTDSVRRCGLSRLLTRSGLAEFLNATLFLPMKLNHA